MLARICVTAFSAASARARASAAPAAVSSWRLVSAVSAVPSDFIALSAADNRSDTPGSGACGRVVDASSFAMRSFNAAVAVESTRAASPLRAGKKPPNQSARSTPVMIAAPAPPAATICHSAAPPCADPMPWASGSRGASRLASADCACAVRSGFSPVSASGGLDVVDTSVAFRSMVGAVRLRRPPPAGSGVVGLSAMHIYLGESAQPRRQEITQIMHMYQQSRRPCRQQFDQRGFVSPGSNQNVTGAGERFGNLCRQAKVPYRERRTYDTRALCPSHIVLCTAPRKMQHGIDFAGLERVDQ